MLTCQPLQVVSITAAVDVAEKYFVDFNGNICALNEKSLGVSHVNTSAGEQLPVMAVGIAVITTGGAIAIGGAVKSNGDGKGVIVTTGVPPEFINGFALDASTGADEYIRIKLV